MKIYSTRSLGPYVRGEEVYGWAGGDGKALTGERAQFPTHPVHPTRCIECWKAAVLTTLETVLLLQVCTVYAAKTDVLSGYPIQDAGS